MRRVQFVNGEYYHIYNRGVEKREIFMDEVDYIRFLWSLKMFNNESLHEWRDYMKRKFGEVFPQFNSERSECRSGYLNFARATEPNSEYSEFGSGFRGRLVEIVCYCLLPNHFHLLLRQTKENGISRFLHKVGVGYTNYFNQKHKRVGPLFQGSYKSIYVKRNEYLLWLSAYIHGNPEIHKISQAETYRWSSFLEYLGKCQEYVYGKDEILKQFGNNEEYRRFVQMVIEESKKRKEDGFDL